MSNDSASVAALSVGDFAAETGPSSKERDGAIAKLGSCCAWIHDSSRNLTWKKKIKHLTAAYELFREHKRKITILKNKEKRKVAAMSASHGCSSAIGTDGSIIGIGTLVQKTVGLPRTGRVSKITPLPCKFICCETSKEFVVRKWNVQPISTYTHPDEIFLPVDVLTPAHPTANTL